MHHRKITFLDEYRKFLKAFEIDWNEEYIFTEPAYLLKNPGPFK